MPPSPAGALSTASRTAGSKCTSGWRCANVTVAAVGRVLGPAATPTCLDAAVARALLCLTAQSRAVSEAWAHADTYAAAALSTMEFSSTGERWLSAAAVATSTSTHSPGTVGWGLYLCVYRPSPSAAWGCHRGRDFACPALVLWLSPPLTDHRSCQLSLITAPRAISKPSNAALTARPADVTTVHRQPCAPTVDVATVRGDGYCQRGDGTGCRDAAFRTPTPCANRKPWMPSTLMLLAATAHTVSNTHTDNGACGWDSSCSPSTLPHIVPPAGVCTGRGDPDRGDAWTLWRRRVRCTKLNSPPLHMSVWRGRAATYAACVAALTRATRAAAVSKSWRAATSMGHRRHRVMHDSPCTMAAWSSTTTS